MEDFRRLPEPFLCPGTHTPTVGVGKSEPCECPLNWDEYNEVGWFCCNEGCDHFHVYWKPGEELRRKK